MKNEEASGRPVKFFGRATDWTVFSQRWSGRQCDRMMLVLGLAGFLLACLLNLHGFSIGSWQGVLGTETSIGRLLFGEPRGIRSDDWLSTLPNIFAQIAHQPAFPAHNTNMFLGQNMLAQYVPTFHSVTLFRPTLWGYFVSADFGLAWQWWGRLLGLFASLYLFQVRTLGIMRSIAFPLSILFVFSPFIQFWSLNSAEIFVFAILSVVCARELFQANSLKAGLSFGLLSGYSAAALFFTLYPPYQIVIGWYCTVVVVSIFLCHRNRQGVRFWFTGMSVALFIVALALGNWYVDSQDLISKMTATAYPGSRFFNGGGMQLGRLFVSNFFVDRLVPRWEAYGNICESASFVLLFPLGGISLLAFSRGLKDRFQSFVFWGSLLFCLFVVCFLVFGFPDVLSRYTLFSQVLTQRAISGLGLASTIVTGLGLQAAVAHPRFRTRSHSLPAWLLPIVFGVLVAVALYFIGHQVRQDLGVRAAYVNRSAAFYGVAVAFLFFGVRWVLFAFAALGFWSTMFFNPVVQGGYTALRTTPLARVIDEVAASARGQAWIGVGQSEIGNYIKILGYKTFNGIQFEPQNSLWSQIDPTGEQKTTYNRYAHITINLRQGSADPKAFHLLAPDAFSVWLESDQKFFKDNGIRFAVVATPANVATDGGAFPGFNESAAVGRWRVLERKDAEGGP